ncbi:hypothetical protein ANN_03912 [Periplaneta americana]|uniref:Uncharacterized protein n=1 Tax=Periplaneta americana TaxID=6978 RepID=A0ABQ8T8B4_PERAM|nr:hypothetical protein ANN_03912 [Periplaneta americana]
MEDWSQEKRSGGAQILNELIKSCYVQGLADDRVKMVVRTKGEKERLTQLIETAIEEESSIQSGQKSKDRDTRFNQEHYRHASRGSYMRSDKSVIKQEIKQEPRVNAVEMIQCF